MGKYTKLSSPQKSHQPTQAVFAIRNLSANQASTSYLIKNSKHPKEIYNLVLKHFWSNENRSYLKKLSSPQNLLNLLIQLWVQITKRRNDLRQKWNNILKRNEKIIQENFSWQFLTQHLAVFDDFIISFIVRYHKMSHQNIEFHDEGTTFFFTKWLLSRMIRSRKTCSIIFH